MKKLLVILLSVGFINLGIAATAHESHHAAEQSTSAHKHPAKATHSHAHKATTHSVHHKSKSRVAHSKVKHQKVTLNSHHRHRPHSRIAMTSDVIPPVIAGESIAPSITSSNHHISTPDAVDINLVAHQPRLYSRAALVMDPVSGKVLISKNPDAVVSIASITKLMTAMVVLDSGVPLDDYVTIGQADIDTLKNTPSRLKVGMQLRRCDLLLLALMSSENRAAHALARTTFPGGTHAFIAKMNAKARSLGMYHTQFYDPTGLTEDNRSTAIDLSKMVQAAYKYSLIRKDTTTKNANVALGPRYVHQYINSDALVRGDRFEIALSKTGFINQSGHCLVLYSMVKNHPIVMVFLNSAPKNGRLADALAARNYISDRIDDILPDNSIHQVDYTVSSSK